MFTRGMEITITPPLDGVTKFKQEFTKSFPLPSDTVIELDRWRNIMHDLGLIGRDPNRYGGAAYGNVSRALRIGEEFSDRKYREFIATGTETGGIKRLGREHYTTVWKFHPEQNLVFTKGPIKATSESMTHGQIFVLDPSAMFAFHFHDEDMWELLQKLKMPQTKEGIEYGSVGMAHEVTRLFQETNVKKVGVFAMLGHPGGGFVFGKSSNEAGMRMLSLYQASRGNN